MKFSILLVAILILQLTNLSYAGTLNKGNWTSSGCGSKPNPPVIDDRIAEVFNKSAEAVNDWQQEAKSYYECLIKEANNDNALQNSSIKN